MEKLKVFEAFAGIGAQHAALKKIGANFEVVGISEIDKYAIKSYEAIHGPVKNYGDISKIEARELPEFDLFTYSFPCQDLSVAGARAGFEEGTRSGLLYECQKIIEAKKPKYLLLENVKNLIGQKFKPDFDRWLEYLAGLGYSNYWQVLNAKDYGVPQNRERVFVVSILNDSTGYRFPEVEGTEKRIIDIMEPAVDERFYMDKPFERVNKGNVRAILDMKGNDCIRRVYDIQGPAPTLTTMQGGHREPKVLIEDRVRKLTPLECWRLMGFEDSDFYKAQAICSNSQLYKQAGNSIVVNVLESIFKELFIEER